MSTAALDLGALVDGQRVRYRTATRDDASGIRPEWTPWQTGVLYLARRDRAVRHGNVRRKSYQAGAILTLTIKGAACAEYDEDDYNPSHNEWMVEEWRLQFVPLEPAPTFGKPSIDDLPGVKPL